MTDCCNAHDVCYDTCGQDKEQCDFDFKRCLYKMCEKYEVVAGQTVGKGMNFVLKIMPLLASL